VTKEWEKATAKAPAVASLRSAAKQSGVSSLHCLGAEASRKAFNVRYGQSGLLSKKVRLGTRPDRGISRQFLDQFSKIMILQRQKFLNVFRLSVMISQTCL
jgi:hypothetical protein